MLMNTEFTDTTTIQEAEQQELDAEIRARRDTPSDIPIVRGETTSTKGSETFLLGTSQVPVMRQLSVAILLLVVVFGATYLGTIARHSRPTTNAQEMLSTAQVVDTTATTTIQNQFNNTVITARAAFVWDVKEQRALFSKNADESLPLASVTKLMTALVSYELLDGTDTVSISQTAIKTSGDSGLKSGEKFTAQDLTDLTLIESSNDGATALSEAAGAATKVHGDPTQTFIAAMNLRAQQLGLSSMRFNNVTGLDVSKTVAGAYGSARNVAFLMEYIITHYPDVLALTKMDMKKIDNTEGQYHLAKNTNTVVDKLEGLIASKTGYTDLAGGNLVVAFDAGLNHPIVVAVLGSTENGRFDDALNLAERARASVESK